MSFVDKKQHFNTLVSRFEVFLKKVYYLRNHTTIVSTKPGSEGQKATLADCIYQTPCLKRLKYSEDVNDKKFFDYLSKVRDWRNDNAHKAPTATEQECDEAINILTSIYLYVVAFGIRSRNCSLWQLKFLCSQKLCRWQLKVEVRTTTQWLPMELMNKQMDEVYEFFIRAKDGRERRILA